MDRCMNETIAFLNLFDIVATTATGIAAPLIGADDIPDDNVVPIEIGNLDTNPANDDIPSF